MVESISDLLFSPKVSSQRYGVCVHCPKTSRASPTVVCGGHDLQETSFLQNRKNRDIIRASGCPSERFQSCSKGVSGECVILIVSLASNRFVKYHERMPRVPGFLPSTRAQALPDSITGTGIRIHYHPLCCPVTFGAAGCARQISGVIAYPSEGAPGNTNSKIWTGVCGVVPVL